MINAQDPDTRNFFEDDENFTYLRFPIAHWWRSKEDMNSHVGVRRYFAPLFAFVEKVLRAGGNVMVHCLAGAHRAGTSGVALAMYYLRLSAIQGTMFVKERRPIVDPIGSFPELLKRLDLALQDLKKINALVEKEKLSNRAVESQAA